MLRLFSCLILVSLMAAKEVPLSLSKDIATETNALVFYPSNKWEELGYNSYHKKMSDVAIDDSGYVHIVIDEHYRPHKHIWSYLCYNKWGRKLIQKEIYSGEYITTLHSCLGSQLLINPDNTVLVFYPDTAFYSCWVKLDRKGNIIERHKAKWWSGGVGGVCSAGQDSFHIVTFPVSFRTLIKQYDPVIGEFYLETNPTLIAQFFYLNNFSLQERVLLPWRFRASGVSSMISLPDKRVFCFSQIGQTDALGVGWFLTSMGKGYEGEQFKMDTLEKICFAKVSIDTIIERIAKEVRAPISLFGGMPPDDYWIPYFLGSLANVWQPGVGLFPDSTVGLGLYRNGTLYLVKYDLAGRIIRSGKGEGKIVKIAEMDKERTLPFIFQFLRTPTARSEAMDKTIFYWGFDDLGNFFLQVY